MANEKIFITIEGETTLCLPASLKNLTTYICLEQGDWFEDEIKFIRKLIKPRMKVIDIGANFGIYSMVMAKLAGNAQIVSFEPDPRLTPYLENSIAKNGLSNIIVKNIALSDKNDRINFYTGENSEYNSISYNPQFHSQNIEVDALTLDQCREKFSLNKIDFIKIDAEGEEIKIFAGAKKFLSEESPLIMFECSNIDYLPLINDLLNFGYQPYKLIPGLNILTAVQPETVNEIYQLNLFCCKQEREKILETEGLLISAAVPENLPEVNPGLWQQKMAGLPFCTSMLDRWIRNTSNQVNIKRNKYLQSLNYYFMSREESLMPDVKYYFLNQALSELESIKQIHTSSDRMQTLIRILSELGMRSKAVEMLKLLVNMLKDVANVHIKEPFIPVSERFEKIVPDKRIKNWCLTSLIEQYEKLASYSSFFTGISAVDYLNKTNSDLYSDEMKRRLVLSSLLGQEKTEIDLTDQIWEMAEFKNLLKENKEN